MKQLSLISFLLSIFLISCESNNKQWQEVSSIKKIQAGSIFKIEPIKDSVYVLSGSDFSSTPVKFNCTALKPRDGMKYKGAMSLQSSRGSRVIFETTSEKNYQVWPANTTAQAIEISIIILPTLHTYQGKGKVYLYLVDSTETCISNIIAWKLAFK